MDTFDKGLVAGLAAVIALTAFMGFAAVQEEREWQAYASENDCTENPERYRPVNSTSTMPMIASGSKGVGTGVAIHSSTKWEYAWECANGEVHWR